MVPGLGSGKERTACANIKPGSNTKPSRRRAGRFPVSCLKTLAVALWKGGLCRAKDKVTSFTVLSFQTVLSRCEAIDVRADDRGSKVGLLTVLCTYVT